MTKRVSVVMDCPYLHVISFEEATYAPRVGEVIWDRRCGAERPVKEAPPNYRIKCQGCRYTRHYGGNQERADAEADSHHRKTAHAVRVYDGFRVVRVAETQTLSLDTLLEAPSSPPEGAPASADPSADTLSM